MSAVVSATWETKVPLDGRGDMVYVAARLHARLAKWPDENEWTRLHPIDALNHYLDQARQGSLAGWLAEIHAKHDVHTIEAQLRLQLSLRWAELWRFCPNELLVALQWCQWLPYLELLAGLLDGQSPPGWMHRDPVLKSLLDEQGRFLRDRLPKRAPANLLPTMWQQAPLSALWRKSLVAMVPAGTRTHLTRGPLARGLTAVLTAHPLFPATDSDRALSVDAELMRFIHIDPSRPAALLAYAMMLYWNFLRLRTELVTRCLFAARVGI